MKKMTGKKIAALMTALVLALGVSIPAGTALADEKTDSLRDAIYRTLKEKQKTQEEAPAEIVAPPVSTDSGAAQTEEQTEAQPEEAAAEEAAPEATSPYLRMKVTGAATLMDITADAANAFMDAEVLAAFRIENAEASATVTVALAQKPAMAEGDKLQLVGLNDWIINKRMVVGGLEIGQKVQFTVRMVDGFALILHRAEPATEEAPEAVQPAEEVKPEAEGKSEVEEVKPEEPAQPETEPEITADAVTTPSKADVAKQILKDLTAHTEGPAAAEAEQPEAATEDTEVQNDVEAPTDEPAEEAAEASEEQTETVEENTEVQSTEEENDEEISEELNEELPEQPEAVVREEEELNEEPAEEEAEDEEISEDSDEEEAGEEALEVELVEKDAEETVGEAEEQMEASIEETSNEATVTYIEETMSEIHEETADESIETPIDESAEETEAPVEAAVEETDEAVIEETAEEIPSNPEDLRKLAQKFSDLVILDDYDTPLGIEDFKKITMLDVTDVRIDPDGMSPIFLTLEKDEEVTLIGMEGDWAQIVVGEEIGYIYKDALEAEPVEEEAVTEAAAEETAEEVVQPEMKVTIFTSRRVVMEEGETVNLTSKIEGFDGYEVLYQWECDQGNGFQPVEAANADSYSYIASAESLSWSWQLMVYYR